MVLPPGLSPHGWVKPIARAVIVLALLAYAMVVIDIEPDISRTIVAAVLGYWLRAEEDTTEAYVAGQRESRSIIRKNLQPENGIDVPDTPGT